MRRSRTLEHADPQATTSIPRGRVSSDGTGSGARGRRFGTVTRHGTPCTDARDRIDWSPRSSPSSLAFPLSSEIASRSGPIDRRYGANYLEAPGSVGRRRRGRRGSTRYTHTHLCGNRSRSPASCNLTHAWGELSSSPWRHRRRPHIRHSRRPHTRRSRRLPDVVPTTRRFGPLQGDI